MTTSFLTMPSKPSTNGQATYGMANLRPGTTGLPFVVFISQKDDAKHAARVKWSPGPRVDPNNMGSYSIDPFDHKNGPRLGIKEEEKLSEWILLNREVLKLYWDGVLEYTEDAISQLVSV